MNDQTQKRDAGKFDPLMIDEDLARTLEVCNAVLEFGKAKYGKRAGWMAVDIGRYRSAAARHRRERMKDGISSKDEETGLLHIAHEIINLMFELEMHIRSAPTSMPYFTDYRLPGAPTPPYAFQERMAAKLNGDPQPDAYGGMAEPKSDQPWPNQVPGKATIKYDHVPFERI